MRQNVMIDFRQFQLNVAMQVASLQWRKLLYAAFLHNSKTRAQEASRVWIDLQCCRNFQESQLIFHYITHPKKCWLGDKIRDATYDAEKSRNLS